MQLQNQKIIKARASFVHNSPRKIRLVADSVRGMPVTAAVNYLKLLPQRAARPLLLVYEQALGNAKTNFQVSPGDLTVKSLQINDGPRGPKKADVHAHGARFDRGVRRKRMSHILLELTQIEGTNPKSQIQNPKQITISNNQTEKVEEAEIVAEAAPITEKPKTNRVSKQVKQEKTK